MRVDQQVISGNQDFPEGGFDGFLQSIVCKKVQINVPLSNYCIMINDLVYTLLLFCLYYSCC